MISIIMPIFNRAHIVEETLVSIKNQSYDLWECIIIDDGSTDGTFEALNKMVGDDHRFKLVKRPVERFKGASSCRNYGIEQSTGDFIQFFDSDDIMHPDHLKNKIDTIGNHDLVVCKVEYFSGEFTEDYFTSNRVQDLIYYNDIFKAFIMDQFPMCMVAPMWRKSFLIRFLPINENLKMLIDRELHTRILYERPSYAILNECLVFYRNDLPSINNDFNKTVATGLPSILKTYEITLSLNSDSDVKLHILRKVLGYFRKALTQKDYKSAASCLKFSSSQKLWMSTELKLKKARIFFIFYVVRNLERGETKFNNLLKI